MKIYVAAALGLLSIIFSSRFSEAAAISVANYSFESPATNFVSIIIDSWQKSPPPSDYQTYNGLQWEQQTGLFKNTSASSPDHIDNCDGDQAVWLWSTPGVGLFQEPAAAYRLGMCYRLTAGVIGTGGGMNLGATMAVILYYRDDASNQVPVATTVLTNDPTVFSNNTHFVDCTVTSSQVAPGVPWAGKTIGVLFLSTVETNLEGGYWDLDNVRLEELPGPAPVLLNPVCTNGAFQLTLQAPPGAAFEILSSSEPAAPMSSWASRGILTNSSGTCVFTEPLGEHPQSFYQARQLP